MRRLFSFLLVLILLFSFSMICFADSGSASDSSTLSVNNTVFSSLFEFLGVTDCPSTFGEFLPWYFGVFVSIAFFLVLFRLVSSVASSIGRRRRY